MRLTPTLTQSEVPILTRNRKGEIVDNPEYPSDLVCKSGHVAPSGTRFFSVSGSVLPEINHGIYCELCIEVANRMSRASKLGINLNPEIELKKRMAEAGNGRG